MSVFTENVYKQNIEQLDKVRTEWEQEHIKICEVNIDFCSNIFVRSLFYPTCRYQSKTQDIIPRVLLFALCGISVDIFAKILQKLELI